MGNAFRTDPPQLGYDWEELQTAAEEKAFDWGAFNALGLSWAAFEQLFPGYLDPGTGNIWEDIHLYNYMWEEMDSYQLTWKQIEELTPSHWSDELTVDITENKPFLLQINAECARTRPKITFTLHFDPDKVSVLRRFPHCDVGLQVSEPAVKPEILEEGDGKLKLSYSDIKNGEWSGLITTFLFVPKASGTTTIHID